VDDFPARVGSYELLCPIASGGMAAVYLARQHGLGGFERDVALKLMHPHLREERAWNVEFIEEAKLSAKIRHPNVVQVLDVGDDPSGTYLVMDYVEGDTLARLGRAARDRGEALPRAIAMRVLCDALAGLHAAHELRDERGFPLGVVHRDFSPQNILVGVDGITRLADFGIAKAASRMTHTQTGSIKGKVAYMSPEQARGETVDRRADVWAAGVVAWEIVAQRRLYSGDPIAIGLRIVTERPPRVSEFNPDVSPELDDAIASALEPRLDARCPTAEELRKRLSEATELADVSEVASLASRVCEDSLTERRARAVRVRNERALEEPTIVTPTIERRSRVWFWVAGLVVIGGVGTAFALNRAPPKAPEAQPVASPTPTPTPTPSPTPTPTPTPTPSPTPKVTTTKKPPKPIATSKTKPLAPNPYE
jgi:eukaryotic-like serine/threonine-protein kinase